MTEVSSIGPCLIEVVVGLNFLVSSNPRCNIIPEAVHGESPEVINVETVEKIFHAEPVGDCNLRDFKGLA